MQVLIGHIIAAASGSFVIDLVGSQDESNRPLVLRRSDTETSFPVLSAYGAVQIGHRDSLFSGMADVFGRVTSGSNHTHREHVLRNAPAERARFQESIVDVYEAKGVDQTPGHAGYEDVEFLRLYRLGTPGAKVELERVVVLDDEVRK